MCHHVYHPSGIACSWLVSHATGDTDLQATQNGDRWMNVSAENASRSCYGAVSFLHTEL